ncbi:MAG: hypothetical protein JNJ94_12665 [Chlorobi bacterium]|nr:hypothetical protein [Chlorobiota bacterium]
MNFTDDDALRRGDDIRIPFTLTITDVNGTEHFLSEVGYTDYKLWFTVKAQLSDADNAALFQKTTTASQIVITNASQNKGYVIINAADTVNCDTETAYWYDLQIKTTACGIKTCNVGKIEFKADVSRATA